jgi:hypothetical protein
MGFWAWFWSAVWFVGLGLFAGMAVIITVRGGRDLAALLRQLRNERDGR